MPGPGLADLGPEGGKGCELQDAGLSSALQPGGRETRDSAQQLELRGPRSRRAAPSGTDGPVLGLGGAAGNSGRHPGTPPGFVFVFLFGEALPLHGQRTNQRARRKRCERRHPERSLCRRRLDGETGQLATRGTARQSEIMNGDSPLQNVLPLALRSDEHGFPGGWWLHAHGRTCQALVLVVPTPGVPSFLLAIACPLPRMSLDLDSPDASPTWDSVSGRQADAGTGTEGAGVSVLLPPLEALGPLPAQAPGQLRGVLSSPHHGGGTARGPTVWGRRSRSPSHTPRAAEIHDCSHAHRRTACRHLLWTRLGGDGRGKRVGNRRPPCAQTPPGCSWSSSTASLHARVPAPVPGWGLSLRSHPHSPQGGTFSFEMRGCVCTMGGVQTL